MLDSLLRDLRLAARMLRKSPGFTVTAVLTLGLGIGANTAIFSVVDAVLLRPLPYPQPGRLAQVSTLYRSGGVERVETAQDGRTWEMVRDHAGAIDRAAAGGVTGVNFVAHNRAQYVQQQRVGAGFFRVLGVNPLIGREFTVTEDRVGGPAVTVLSYSLWKSAFHADPAVVGRAVTLRGEPYTIVGVMPPGFQSNSRADLWTPLRPSTTGEGSGTNYGIIARLQPGTSWAEAESQIGIAGLSAIAERHLPPGVSARFSLVPLQTGLTQGLRSPLLILWGAVGLVLLIACVNLAGLLLARSSRRVREIATRMALGSGRGAVTRQLLAESLLLALAGGTAGVGFGYLGLHGLVRLGRDSLPLWQTVGLDARVLAATGCAALLTSLLFGLAPALQATRIDIRAALVEGGARGIAGSASRWQRRLLVTAEVAIGVVLLIGAGLLIRTLAHLRGLHPGFDPTGVITAKLSLQDARYGSSQSVNRLFDESLARIRQLPGVESAAVVLGLPYERILNVPFRLAGRLEITNLCYVTPEYFRTLRIPLLRGRVFAETDQSGSAPVIIVNEAFARTYLRGQEPIGSHLALSTSPGYSRITRPHEIVGLVGDVQQRPGWGDNGPLAPTPIVYIPATQTSDDLLKLVHIWFSPSWIVRTAAPVEGIIAGMQRAVEAVDPQLPFAGFRSMSEVQSASFAWQRFLASLLAALAGLALLLAAIGIYGLIANSVVERTQELGIRMALGATVAQAMKTVALPGILLALAGVAAGCILAAGAAGLMRHLIWGVSATDPATFAGVAATLLLVAAVASSIPAMRILRLDPASVLHHE